METATKKTIPRPPYMLKTMIDRLMYDIVETNYEEERNNELFTREDVKNFAYFNVNKVYVVIYNNVFDFTTFLDKYPDALPILKDKSGCDATKEFRKIYLKYENVEDELFDYCIGRIVKEEWIDYGADSDGSTVSNGQEELTMDDIPDEIDEPLWIRYASQITMKHILLIIIFIAIICVHYVKLDSM